MNEIALLIADVIELLFEYWQNINCPGCGGSGFRTPANQDAGWGAYDLVCDDCGGQSASANRSYFVRGAL